MTETKKNIYNACVHFVESRLKTIKNVIDSNTAALTLETKSSAGDKHETGRAMLQLEIEKAGQQLKSVMMMQQVLSKINLSKKSNKASLGSLVVTDKATYFLAISAGKITIDDTDYFAVSAISPIGKQLLGKNVGDFVTFNKATVLEVC